MNKIILFILVVSFVLSSCTSTQQATMYNWFGYENISYKFLKKRTDEETEKLIACYEIIINEANGIRKVPPPGICADYGFLLLQMDKVNKGISFLNLEKKYYPESENFIDKIIDYYKEQ